MIGTKDIILYGMVFYILELVVFGVPSISLQPFGDVISYIQFQMPTPPPQPKDWLGAIVYIAQLFGFIFNFVTFVLISATKVIYVFFATALNVVKVTFSISPILAFINVVIFAFMIFALISEVKVLGSGMGGD